MVNEEWKVFMETLGVVSPVEDGDVSISARQNVKRWPFSQG